MTRTSSTLILVLATIGMAIAPMSAAASGEYDSINAIMGGGDEQSQTPSGNYSSVNALVGGDEQSPGPSGEYSSVSALVGADEQSQTPSGGYSSVNALVGSDGQPHSTPSEYSSVSALVGADPSGQAPAAAVAETTGDDRSDALIGVLVGIGLMLMTLAVARSVARHRRSPAESRA